MRRRRAERTRGVALAQGWVPAFFVANFFSSSWLGPSNQSSLLTGRDLGTPKNFGPLPPVDRARPDASNLINFLQVKPFFSFIWPQRKNPGGRSVLRWMQTCGGLKISDPTKPINLFLAKSAGTQRLCAGAEPSVREAWRWRSVVRSFFNIQHIRLKFYFFQYSNKFR